MDTKRRGLRRWSLRVLIAAIVLLFVGCAAVMWRWTRYPQHSGYAQVDGVSEPVEIYRGAHGVPHILAASPKDALFGLGFCEGQDRTFQLEVMRRAASGTLSEVIGEAGLEIDRLVRTLGIPQIATRQLEAADPAAVEIAQAFCDGINAGFASLDYLPPEFIPLGVKPAPWKPVDCLALARLVAFGLAEDARTEAFYARLRERCGEDIAEALLPIQPVRPWEDRVEGPAPRVAMDPGLVDGIGQLRSRLGLSAGCSNWIAAGSRTKSGKPVFAYDSHQGGARAPSELYLAHFMGGDEVDAIGVVIVGLPGLYAGAIHGAAFGPTNLGGDCQDLFVVERVEGEPGRYEIAGEAYEFEVRVEEIAVKGREEPLRLEVEETVLGPVVSTPLGLDEKQAVVLWWAGAAPDLRVDGYITMPLARTWEAFRECLSNFNGAAQHFGYANADGTVAYQVTGPMPKRQEESSPWPARASSATPPPLLTLDELPHTVEPEDGFLATANHRPKGDGEPFYLGRTFVHSARHDRLVELLEAESAMTADGMMQLGLDLTSALARRVAPVLVNGLGPAVSDDARFVRETLAEWDYRMTEDGLAPLVYHTVYREAVRALLGDELGDLLEPYASRPEQSQERIIRLLSDPDSSFWDDARTDDVLETRAEVLERAAKAAVAYLTERIGEDRGEWRWGELHTLTYRHYLSEVTSLFDIGPFAVPGDDDTVYRFGSKAFGAEPFDVQTVALTRMVIDLGEQDAIYAVISTGQSGWPFHPYWADQAKLCVEGQLFRIPRTKSEIKETATDRLVLQPR